MIIEQLVTGRNHNLINTRAGTGSKHVKQYSKMLQEVNKLLHLLYKGTVLKHKNCVYQSSRNHPSLLTFLLLLLLKTVLWSLVCRYWLDGSLKHHFT